MGDEVKLYSSGVLVSSATIMTWKTLQKGGFNSMFVESGGTANSINIYNGGSMFVSRGGTANSNTAGFAGQLYISGGVANSTFVHDAGRMYVYSGGTANDTTLYRLCPLTVFSGGTANSTIVSGYLYVSNCGVANYAAIDSLGILYVSSGGTANCAAVNSGGSQIVSSGGTANSTTVNSGGVLHVSNGGAALEIKENGGYVWVEPEASVSFISNSFSGLELTRAWATLHSGTTANSTTINSYGSMFVSGGGTADTTIVNTLGRLYVSSGGTALKIKENGGYVEVDSGTNVTFIANSFSGMVLSRNESASLHSGTTANSTTLNHGYLYVYGGVANTTTVNEYGAMYVSSGGTANTATVNSGWMYVSSGGTANTATVNVGGGLFIYDGGTALEIKENGGYVWGDSGTNVTFIANSFSGLVLSSNGRASLHSGTTANSTTLNDGYLYVYGGEANNTTVNKYGWMYVYPSGTANSTTVNSSGWMYVDDGGVANSTTVGGGNLNVFPGGTANSTTVNSQGWMNVHDRGIAHNTVVNHGGAMYVSSGGIANTTTVNVGGGLFIYDGGTALEIKENGGYVWGDSGTNVTFIANSFSGLVLSSNGRASLHSGTTANSTTLNDGYLYVYGGVANTTTVNNWCLLGVFSGGTANTTIVNCGRMYVSSGGVANSTTVNSSGYLSIESGGTALRIKENGGCVRVDPGTNVTFIANSFSGLVLSDYEDATLHSGTTANSTTVNSDGCLLTYDGGIANVTTVNAGGALHIYSGGTANSTTVNPLGYLGVGGGGTLSGSLQIESGAVVSAYGGSVIDFTVAEQTVSSKALINDWSRISGGAYASYTITVKNDQDLGTYRLADGAEFFALTVTVQDTEGTFIGLLPVGGTFTKNDVVYTLNRQEDQLSLTLAKETITITAESARRKYNGIALTAGWSYSGNLAQGDELFVTVEGTVTDVGSAANRVTSYKVMRGETDVTEKYNFADSVEGVLTVTPRSVTLTSKSDSKVYDGTPLTNHTVTVSGDGFVKGEGYTANVTGSQTDVGSSANTFTYALNAGSKAGNYNITTETGTLTVNPGQVQPAKSDVDGNNISDVMFQYTGGDYQIGFWMNGSSTWQGTGASQPANWELLGAYDMDSSGKADQVMFGNVLGGAYIGYYKDGDTTSSGWQNIGYLNNPDEIKWDNAIGNVTGNAGQNSIVWHAAELGVCGVWTDGTSNWVSINGYYGTGWELQGTGDFNGDGKDEILFSNAGNLYTVDLDSNFASLGGWGEEWQVRAIGDFSGDGKDDIILFHEGTGSVVKFANGQSADWESLGQLDASDWFIVGAGDYDNDQQDDLLVRQYSTGMLGYYSAGDMSKWNEMGRGVDMRWTVIA